MLRHALFLVAFVAVSRLLPHPPNFAPVTAVSVYCGARLGSYMIPIVAMLLSDMVIGFHSLVPVVYSLIILNVYISTKLNSAVSVVANSLLFFIVTNFAMWLLYYDRTLSSLVECYTSAVPFYQNSLLGDLTYSMILFGLGSTIPVRSNLSYES